MKFSREIEVDDVNVSKKDILLLVWCKQRSEQRRL